MKLLAKQDIAKLKVQWNWKFNSRICFIGVCRICFIGL